MPFDGRQSHRISWECIFTGKTPKGICGSADIAHTMPHAYASLSELGPFTALLLMYNTIAIHRFPSELARHARHKRLLLGQEAPAGPQTTLFEKPNRRPRKQQFHTKIVACSCYHSQASKNLCQSPSCQKKPTATSFAETLTNSKPSPPARKAAKPSRAGPCKTSKQRRAAIRQGAAGAAGSRTEGSVAAGGRTAKTLSPPVPR